MFNILNGGKHAQDSTDFQEFMVMPVGVGDVQRRAARRRRDLRRAARRSSTTRATRPARATRAGSRRRSPSNEAAVEVILRAIERAGYRPGEDVAIALDPATTELVEAGSGGDGAPTRYVLAKEGRTLDSGELIDLWADWATRYPIVSIEDGLAEDDWAGWQALTARLGGTIQLVGDDLLVTNTERIARGIELARRELRAHQAQPDRHADRDDRGDRARARRRLVRGRLAPLGRDRGHHDRRPRRRDGHGPDQDRRPVALGAGRQVQPAAADRGRARRRAHALRPGRVARLVGVVNRFVDRGAITAAYVGIGMAVTIGISFLLVIPIEPIVWLLALPSG